MSFGRGPVRGLGSYVMTHPKLAGHGDLCTCRLLAIAIGSNPKMLRFNYCKTVLQRRWRVECNHGCAPGERKPSTVAKWQGFGPIDPVKAVLIMNEE